MQCSVAVVSGGIVSRTPVLSTLLGLRNEWLAWLAGSFVDDIIITICMTHILSQAKNRTSWNATETMLTTLINRVIQSGAATVIVAAIDLAVFVQLPDKNYFYVPSYILGKVYTNSFMLNLNLRRPNGSRSEQDALPLSLTRSEGIRVERSIHRDMDAEGDIKWVSADPTTNNTEHRVNIGRVHGGSKNSDSILTSD
ncbi:hypothetical protein B0H19DRAFT_93184 [Mycena capillaripes]|nr:hypothetical protein B0H19DRAFT_93184 [Mycena capillaripes]